MTPEKRSLVELTKKVCRALAVLDVTMKLPSAIDRGKKIAEIANFLDMANDVAMHFGLGYGFKKIGNIKKAAQKREFK